MLEQFYGEHIVLCRNDVTYVGSGKDTVLMPIGRTLNGLDMFYFNDFLDSDHATNEYLENVHWRNLVIDASETWCTEYATSGKGFMLNLCRNCTWEKVDVLNSDGTGFGMDCTVDCRINDCFAQGCGKSATEAMGGASGFGIGYGYANEESMKITNCVSVGNKKFGYFFENQARFNPLYLATTHGEFSATDCVARGNLADYGGLMSTGVTYTNCESLGARKCAFYFGVSSHDVSIINCSAIEQFMDVEETYPYYDAVTWAVTNGLTQGTEDLFFSPEAGCTRAHLVTFLWRMAGIPLSAAELPYEDVSADAYYAPAVRWAAERGLLSAFSGASFEANRACTGTELAAALRKYTQNASFAPELAVNGGAVTRGEAVSALYRAAAVK